MKLRMLALVLAFGTPPLAAAAQQAAAPACAAMDKDLPAVMAAWPDRTGLPSAATEAGLPGAQILVGRAGQVSLHRSAEITYPAAPGKAGGADSFGGLLEFAVDQPGDYAVALSSGAWLDVAHAGKPIVSSAHGHGPACSTIHKVVDFQLQPGRYVLEISANPEPRVGLMLLRRP
jgi:hypothetical protein